MQSGPLGRGGARAVFAGFRAAEVSGPPGMRSRAPALLAAPAKRVVVPGMGQGEFVMLSPPFPDALFFPLRNVGDFAKSSTFLLESLHGYSNFTIVLGFVSNFRIAFSEIGRTHKVCCA